MLSNKEGKLSGQKASCAGKPESTLDTCFTFPRRETNHEHGPAGNSLLNRLAVAATTTALFLGGCDQSSDNAPPPPNPAPARPGRSLGAGIPSTPVAPGLGIGEARPPVSQAQGEAIIESLTAEIIRQYPSHRKVELLPIYFIKGPEKIFLLKGTDLFLTKEQGGPAVLELTHRALEAGPRYANTDDALCLLANFPGVPKFRAKLAELLDSPNPAVRVGALLALSRMPHESLIPSLEKRLKDENQEVRRAAIIAFGPEERHIFTAFMLESPQNEALLKGLTERNQPISLAHPYRNNQVFSILDAYLKGPIPVQDMPVILQTVANLKMSNLLSSKAMIHNDNATTEAFMQQCYRELGAQQ